MKQILFILILFVLNSCATPTAMKNCNYVYEEKDSQLVRTEDSVCYRKTIFGTWSLW